MSRMEPVAWAPIHNDRLTYTVGERIVAYRTRASADVHVENGGGAYERVAGIYTADQIREMVERVRAKPNTWIDDAMLDAILAQLDADPPTTDRTEDRGRRD